MNKKPPTKYKWSIWVFDLVFRSVKKKLSATYDEAFSQNIVSQSKENFKEFLPQIPYVGGIKNYFSPVILINGWIIAMHRAMRTEGKSAEDTIKIWAEVIDDLFAKIPAWFARFMGNILMSKPVINGFRRQTQTSQKRTYPGDWVYRLLKGDGINFDMGFEFSECAVIKLYKTMNTMDLAPYCNFVDITYSHYLKIGLNANQTLGLGDQTCQMLFKQGRETLIPPKLVNIIPLANK